MVGRTITGREAVYIDPKGTICGYPSMEIRRLLQHLDNPFYSYGDGFIQRILGLSARRATQLRKCLMTEGLIEPNTRGRERGRWEISNYGVALSHASAAKPVTRATAERVLREFLSRVETVNANDDYAYKIARVAVFGSFMSDAPRLNDLDLMIHYIHRREPIDEYMKHCKERIRVARKRGRPLATLGQEMMWPHTEVLLYLKSHSRTVALHDWESHKNFLDTRPHRIVYELSASTLDSPP